MWKKLRISAGGELIYGEAALNNSAEQKNSQWRGLCECNVCVSVSVRMKACSLSILPPYMF